MEFISPPRLNGVSMYSPFTFDPLYSLSLSISKLVKGYTVYYLSSDRLVTKGPVKERKSFLRIRARAFCRCNLLLKTVEADGGLPGITIYFSQVGEFDGGAGLFRKTSYEVRWTRRITTHWIECFRF